MHNVTDKVPNLLETQYPKGNPVLLWSIDREGIFQFLEGEFPSNISIQPFEVIGSSIFNAFAQYPRMIKVIQSALDGNYSRIVHKHGSQLWKWYLYPFPAQQKHPDGVIGMAFDLYLQEKLWHQEALMETAAELRKARTLEEMSPIINSQLRKLLDIDQVALVLNSPNGSSFELIYSWGLWDQVSGKNQPPAEILTDPELIEHLRKNSRMVGKYFQKVLRSPHVYGYPLIVHDQLLGALWIGRKEPIMTVESKLIKGISDMAANAFQRARQHELTRRRLERLAALHSIDQAISGSFNLNLTLHIILDQVVSQLDVDAADVFLVNPDTMEVTYAEGRGFQQYQPEVGISKAREDLAWRVLKNHKLIAIPDLYKSTPSLRRGKMFAVEGFRSYYGIPLIAKGKTLGVMEVFHRKPLRVDNEWFEFLRALGTQAAIALDNAAMVEDLQRTNLKLDKAYNTTLEGLVRALDLRDKFTGEHTQRVVKRTLKLAKAVGIPDKQLIHVRRGALLHDLGKLGVPDSILNKSGPLNEEEWVLMKKHPVYAKEILESIEFLRPAIPIPYAHHEKWDGTGYPLGISGNLIQLEARVFAVIDVWDALKTPRPYRKAWSEEEVHRFIRDGAGSHFDPEIVKMWEKVFQIPE